MSYYKDNMSRYDASAIATRYTQTSQSHPAPACMGFAGVGAFRLISLTTMERHQGPTREREHSHQVYHLVLFTEADNSFVLEGEKVASTRGLCVLTAPGVSHCFLPLKPGTTRYHAITFAFDSLAAPPSWGALLKHYTGLAPQTVPSRFVVPEPTLLRLSPLVTGLRGACSKQGAVAAHHLHFGVLQIFSLVAELLLEQQRTRRSPPEIGARDFLDAHFARRSSLATIAHQFGVTPAHLGRAFKRRYGISPSRYQDELRIEAARNLLRHSDLLVKEIAHQLGYPDAFTFSKAFRRSGHGSPRAYRSDAQPGSSSARSALKRVR